MKKKFKRLMIIAIAAVVLFQGGRYLFMKEEWAARNYLHEQVKSTFPEAAGKAARGYGISQFRNGERHSVDIRLSSDASKPVVVLIHGLDEPGRVWQNLAPILDGKGFTVLYMTYPNDQRITASARLFFESLKKLELKLGNGLVIIGHSMGGLVSREMLTSPKISYDDHQALGLVPRVTRLIMVGTPNHGSQLARFRLVMEIRDQIQALWETDATWLQGVLDGTGAAGLDLIPGSDFLTRLNSRPHPGGVELHVIAGILSPWPGAGLNGQHPGMDGVETALKKFIETLGDGLVTVDSATLDNIGLTRVNGNHMTMIRNLTKESTRMPPAIPVILDILESQPKGRL